MVKDTREPAEILDHITRSRANLTATIYGLSEAQLTTPGVVGHWSVKDVMAHIARWETVCFETLRDHIEGKDQPEEDYRDFLTYNDKWEPELRALTLLEAITQFEIAHYRLFGFLSALQPEQWNGYVRAWVANSSWQHFDEHTAQIFSWRVAQ